MPSSNKEIIIGTRGSKLALCQANWVKDRLREKFPERDCRLRVIKTRGDKIIDTPLAKIGGKGLFVKEIEEALLNREIDLAVHSMKDMPSAIPEGLSVGAVPRRESPCDALISAGHTGFSDLPPGVRVGTSSLRRASQLCHARPDVVIVPLRGNVDTRLSKLEQRQMDAIILAAAGLTRLGLADRITEQLDQEVVLPAVAQGALCLEIRTNDEIVLPLVETLDHADSRTAVTAERAFLHRLEGGCQVPIAGLATVVGETLSMRGLVADLSGTTIIRDAVTGPRDKAAELGINLADKLLAAGAGEILSALMEADDNTAGPDIS
ncbi:MAG: hydroxymethylbilane synthase [Desulfosudaceae bacterium]